MTLSSRKRAQHLLKEWSIDPKTVCDDDSLDESGYWRFGEAPTGYRHPVKIEDGLCPKHWVPWPDKFPVEDLLRLIYPAQSAIGGNERLFFIPEHRLGEAIPDPSYITAGQVAEWAAAGYGTYVTSTGMTYRVTVS